MPLVYIYMLFRLTNPKMESTLQSAFRKMQVQVVLHRGVSPDPTHVMDDDVGLWLPRRALRSPQPPT